MKEDFSRNISSNKEHKTLIIPEYLERKTDRYEAVATVCTLYIYS